MRRKAAIAVSAMLLAAQLGSPISAQQPSLDQLNAIAGLLDANDVGGLRAYLDTNPELLEGDTQLAVLLRRFLTDSEDIAAFLAFEPDLGETLREATLAEEPPEEGSDSGDDPDPPEEGSDTGGDPDPTSPPDEAPTDEGPDRGEDPDTLY